MAALLRTVAILLLVASSGAAAHRPPAGSVAAGRAHRMEVEARRADRRYLTEKTGLATGDGLAVRYRGLYPVPSLALVPLPDPPGFAWKAFELRTPAGPLQAPGVLELDLSGLALPPTPVRQPLDVLEVYQELHRGQGWLQLPPIHRDPRHARLVVNRDDWGTGRIAIASRLEQPAGLFERPAEGPADGPEVIVLHGVDGARSDYSGRRDMLALARRVGSRVWFFQYPSGHPMMENVEALARALAELRQELGPRRPTRRVMIGYSMGGLIARGLLEELGTPTHVDDLVLLATPSRGVEWPHLLTHLPGLRAPLAEVRRTWAGVDELLSGSAFVKRLQEPRAERPATRYLALAGIADGNGDLVVDADSVDLPASRRPLSYRFRWRKQLGNLNQLSHWGVHQELMGNGLGTEILRWLGLPDQAPSTARARASSAAPSTSR